MHEQNEAIYEKGILRPGELHEREGYFVLTDDRAIGLDTTCIAVEAREADPSANLEKVPRILVVMPESAVEALAAERG